MTNIETRDMATFKDDNTPDDSRHLRKYQIFISSTFEDLIEERRTVIETVLAMNHIPVGMEVFEAGNEDQWTYIQNRILEVDYYLVIVAERYGSIGPHGISYTQMEYQFAVESGIPVAALLLNESSRALWPRNKIDFENQQKLNEFRKLCQTRMTSYWTDAGSLAAKCQLALSGLIRRNKRPGWISGDQAMSPTVLSEMARLSKENSDLRDQIRSLMSQRNSDADRERSLSRMRSTLRLLIDENRKLVKFKLPRLENLEHVLETTTILDLISENISEFFDGRMTYYFEQLLTDRFLQKFRSIPDFENERWDVSFGQFISMLLRSWGFVESYSAPRHDGKTTQWLKLSELGRSVFDEAWNSREATSC